MRSRPRSSSTRIRSGGFSGRWPRCWKRWIEFIHGAAAPLAIEGAEIVVTELTREPWGPGVFTCVGLDVLDGRCVVLKSRIYCRPAFPPDRDAEFR
ncbi:MlrC C-terminal domain-containing protein [Castellaniella sp. WN]